MWRLFPCRLRKQISTIPFNFAILVLTTSIPTPRPDKLPDFLFCAESRYKDQVESFRGRHITRLVFRYDPLFNYLSFYRFSIHAASVIFHPLSKYNSSRIALTTTIPFFRFALFFSFFRRFYAMIDCITKHMNKRIVQFLDQRFVKFVSPP